MGKERQIDSGPVYMHGEGEGRRDGAEGQRKKNRIEVAMGEEKESWSKKWQMNFGKRPEV